VARRWTEQAPDGNNPRCPGPRRVQSSRGPSMNKWLAQPTRSPCRAAPGLAPDQAMTRSASTEPSRARRGLDHGHRPRGSPDWCLARSRQRVASARFVADGSHIQHHPGLLVQLNRQLLASSIACRLGIDACTRNLVIVPVFCATARSYDRLVTTLLPSSPRLRAWRSQDGRTLRSRPCSTEDKTTAPQPPAHQLRREPSPPLRIPGHATRKGWRC
jgi:hypothetical protein